MKQNYFYLIFAVILFSGCENETIEAPDSTDGLEYFPNDLNHELIYQYDSIIYDQSRNSIDTFTGFIRDVLTERLDDGRVVVERSFKRLESQPWVTTDLWTQKLEESRAIRTEENLSFIKLVFPPTVGKKWNGNALFLEETEIVVAGETLRPYMNWQYEVEEVSGSWSSNGLNFNDVITINQVSDTTRLDVRNVYEKYARGVGLVEKYMSILDCQCIDVPDSVPWEEKAEKGFILSQKLISFK